MKVYIKKGARNYKEKRLETAIERAIENLMDESTEFEATFKPATNYAELDALYHKYCVSDVEFTDVKSDNDYKSDKEESQTNDTYEKHKEFAEKTKETIQPNNSNEPFTDPFNSAEPIVRDYVTDNGFKEKESNEPNKTNFEEPTDFKSSFDMPPNDDDEKGNGKSNKSETKKEQPKKSEPLNPHYAEMDNGRKKRSTKKFAKLIIEGACILAEKGCIWWTTKDITEDKLAQYQLENTLDLNLLLTLEDNQEQPVIEWFRNRVKDANGLFKVGEQEKADLVDSLYEVMLEKGVAPTPMQELMMNVAKTFLMDMGLKAFALSSQIGNVLNQLKTMKKQELETQIVDESQVEGFRENPVTQTVATEQTDNTENSLIVTE